MNNCKHCDTYSTTNNQALSQHMRRCYKNSDIKIELKVEWYCKICKEYFGSRRIQRAHNKEKMHFKSDFIEKKVNSNFRCKFCDSVRLTNKSGIVKHQNYCKANPNKKQMMGIKKTEAEKLNLSNKMKERHAKGIASRWKNPHLHTSYAESFFIKVIENEFTNKEYVRELRAGKYFIDFAWVDLKLAIEIDGQQHERYQHQRESDVRKDAFLKEEGWLVLRIRFKDMFNNPKHYIKVAKTFIDGV